jgi:hypothetical protein
MTVKYKIGFTVDAETLFGLISKFLPFEHLSVEEVIERPRAVQPRLEPAPKPKRKWASRSMDLEHGVNAIIMGVLADGEPHPLKEMERAIAATGQYSKNSLGSRITNLSVRGVIVKTSPGHWRAVNPVKKSA